MNEAGKNKIIENIRNILIIISPQIDEYTSSYWKIIFESLAKTKILKNNYNLPKKDIKNLMYGLKPYYENISYYWLQLGLSEQLDNDFEKALNHFKQAESIRPHSYHIKHVIGRNFLKQANDTSNFAIANDLFKEGEKILFSLIRNKETSQIRSYSIHSYLHEKIKFIQKFDVDVSNREIKEMFQLLEQLIKKDENDIMAKQMSNQFYKFLQSINKQGLIKIDFYDLERYLSLFKNVKVDVYELDS